ncbi:cobalt transporter [Microcoleus sp. FACHB-1515]|uniref:cobalt transporter n=1 Tax=Cyanophyceae TaxID=3028117 RepID=UPI001688206D|nr:cobalt transporter [Microcoleus sp. FACHB-1515]MBD2093363.1 cobalt transporter [Microcoleus sp. FACHB-1515]
MKRNVGFSLVLALGLVLGAPAVGIAHVGHGDEFQAEGGINRVAVNAETDPLLGILVTPIEPAADGSAAVLIPVTALVDADGKQLVFVQYENFYEPVPITTGATQGELIEVTEGLSVGEKLVTQGGLSLYAESRKTQTADAAATPADQTDAAAAHAQADAQGVPHSHDTAGNLVESGDRASDAAAANQSPIGILAVMGGGAALLVAGAIALAGRNRKKKSVFSNKRGL